MGEHSTLDCSSLAVPLTIEHMSNEFPAPVAQVSPMHQLRKPRLQQFLPYLGQPVRLVTTESLKQALPMARSADSHSHSTACSPSHSFDQHCLDALQ